jgi:BolA family transcriptional regulator, general stress-responsive regulator
VLPSRRFVATISAQIRQKLTAAFSPLVLNVEDESARHAGHAGAREGGESHFRIEIVAGAFEGLSRVERQRRVYAVLKDEFAAGLHALALTTLTPDEAARRT